MSEARPPPHEAWGLFALLRVLERRAKRKARIGRNATLAQEIARIGQDPFLAFPTTDLSDIAHEADGRTAIRSHVIGYFGPQGALPLNTTEEVYRWLQARDASFVRFSDIFGTRFQQLFFRAWSDARAITQFDHEDGDRFRHYIGSFIGIGTPAFQGRGVMDDLRRIALAPAALGRVRSAARLRQMLVQDLGADVDIDEHQPVRIAFEADTLSRLGQQGSTLGRDCLLGSGFTSVNDKITIRLRARSLEDYRSFLPGGARHARLCDIVTWYLGQSCAVEVVLSLPADQVLVPVLGKSVELGWMAFLPTAPSEARPDETASAPDWIRGAEYHLRAEAA
ncbi:MAG: type VI secretion system baseplate subunit TssG [Rubellimicrobium sp.]|nr:type VI secretion system baseplate subunit TssG [Rubellimicrobium sp.]